MQVPEVGGAEAVELRDAGATWIDVREPEEWAEWHIEGTELLPLRQAAATVTERFPDQSATIVISCLSGARSGQLVAAMRRAGYTDVHNLRGGINAWAREGRPVVSGG